MRVGLIGYGYWGSKHVRVLSGLPGVELTVIENRPDRLREAVSSFPATHVASCLGEVQDELDAVVIATPPRTHGPVALQALRVGLHTMVEKPLATSVEVAEALVETADTGGLTLMVGHTFEYNAAVWKLKQIISSGELGRILYIDTARLSLGRYQNDCNVIWDLAPHDISIVSYLLGEFPETASVWARRNVGDVHADVAYLRLDFPRTAATAFVHVSWLDPNKVRRVIVVGERRMVVYNDLSDNERIRIYDVGVDPAGIDQGPATYAMPVTYRTGDITSPHVQFVEPLLVQDTHFIDCVRTGRRPDTPGERGLGVVRVLAATDEARATGAPARIQPPAVNRIATTVARAEVPS
ncbi:oxidoreductase [Mycobacterium sp. Soil538]|nr:oxidoreductase [Mycobacterium sp. Soil538]